MAELLVVGGGISGLSAGMLLARDGHTVTLLERDGDAPPETAAEIWADWERPGVTQFRLPHYFQPRMTLELTREVPEVLDTAVGMGALRSNLVELSTPMTGAARRDGDEIFDIVTGRRPVIEAAFATVAEATPGLTVRRGVAVEGLLAVPSTNGAAPHVVGVRTTDGEELRADLVIDCGGRRSALPRWLAEVGAREPVEEREDFGFVYYGRVYEGDALPEQRQLLLTPHGSIALLTLPADNNTWMATLVCQGGDAPTRRLRDPDVFQRTYAEFPEAAHWVEGRPLHDDVHTMANLVDRLLRFVVDGEPVATGVVAVGDAWACSNPSIGRGSTTALLHALVLRDFLRDSGDAEPRALALDFDAITREQIEPWYAATLQLDRERQLWAQAAIDGIEPESDPSAEIGSAFGYLAAKDPEVFRGLSKVGGMLATVDEVMATPGLLETVIADGSDWRDHPPEGPDRARLLEIWSA